MRRLIYEKTENDNFFRVINALARVTGNYMVGPV